MTEQLMQSLLDKDLSQWLPVEIDGFIVDAYLSLLKSMRGELRSDGLPVQPDMGDWGDVYDADGEQVSVEGTIPAYCLACLAGILFVSKVGSVIPEDNHPQPFSYSKEGSRTVLQFLDGLRYLEEDDEDGAAINALLRGMDYKVIPIGEDRDEEDYRIGSSSSQRVALKLQRFIDLNPRLTDRLRIATTKVESYGS